MLPTSKNEPDGIRLARVDDIPAVVAILTAYRQKLAQWAPQFWQPAEEAAALSTFYLSGQIDKEDTIFLVAQQSEQVIGFALAYETPAPPVYRPGKTGTLDDFGVADDISWEDIGADLLAAIRQNAREAGWEQLIVVSPVADTRKNAVLIEAGLAATAQWWSTRL